MDLLVSDPWAELIRGPSCASCQYPEAEAVQPLVYLRQLRAMWADEGPVPSAVFQSPFRQSHPLIEAISHLLAQKAGRPLPPFSTPSPVLPIGELCQFALLRGDVHLARRIAPFSSFPSLWCPEKDYLEKEAIWSIALLLRAFGKYVPIPKNPDPYFVALAKFSPSWEEKEEEGEGNAALFYTPQMTAAIANAGENIPLGALQAGAIAIPAFGPHAYPLNDPTRFGMRRVLSDRRWASSAAIPEIWFEVKPDFHQGLLETRWLGVAPDRPMAFAYYVRADSARVGEEIFQPKTLKRYNGISKKIVFEKQGSRFAIESTAFGKMEVIPLAGAGCFWNADFLVAFEVPSFDGRVGFKFS